MVIEKHSPLTRAAASCPCPVYDRASGLGLAGFLAFALSLWAVSASAENVLFLGNSYLEDGGGVHTHAARIVAGATSDRAPSLKAETVRGSRLDERDIDAALAAGSFDRVVLQGHSTAALTDVTRSRFRTAVRRMHESVAAAGGQTVLYMTPAYSPAHRRFDPEMFSKIATEYAAMGREIGAPVIPVGLAFEMAYARRPEIALHQRDGSHPTLSGTYLAAATTAAALFGVDPAGSDYTMDGAIASEDAQFLREVAAAAVEVARNEQCSLFAGAHLGKRPSEDYLDSDSSRRSATC